MKPTAVRFSATADADFAGIIDFLKRHAGPITAGRYLGLFDQLFRRLQDFPESGASRSQLGPDVRIGVVRPYVVLYRYSRDTMTDVRILRIVHGRRRIDGRLLRSLH